MIAAELRGGNKPNLSDALGWIGSRVDDIYGAAVGRLEDVWIDPGTGTPRWLLVKEGRFGGRTTLIPFEDATAGAGHVWIPYEREAIRAAPEIEPGAPLTQQVESELREHFRAHAPAAVSHRGHGDSPPASASAPAPGQAPAPVPLGGQSPAAVRQPGSRITASPTPAAAQAPAAASGPAPTPYRPSYADVPPPGYEPTPEPYSEPTPQPIPFGRPAAPQPPPGPPPLRAAEPPQPPAAPGSSWSDPPPRPVLRPAPAPGGEPIGEPRSAEAPPAAIYRAAPPEPDATALPLVHRLDRPYRIELELEGGLRISGELRSLRIIPADES